MGYYRKVWRIYKRFLVFLKPYWKVGVVVGILMIFSSLLQLPAPLLTKYIIDSIIPQKNLNMLNMLILLLVLVILANNVINYVFQTMLINYRIKVEKNIRVLLIEKVFAGPIAFFEKFHAGYVVSRIDSDVNQLGHLFLETLLNIALNILTFFVGLFLLFYLNVKLAVISILSLPLFVVSFHVFSKKMNELMMQKQEMWGIFRGVLTEIISMVKTIKLFGKKEFSLKRIEKPLHNALESEKKLQMYNVISGIAIGITGVLLPLIVLWYGVRQIILGEFTLGGFIAFNSVIGYLYDPVKSFVNLNLNIHSSIAAAERIFEIIDLEEESGKFGTKELKNVDSIEFRNVTFFYPEREEKSGILNISFSIKKGERLAIVGETGSGKSTIVRLLTGFDIPQRGEILFNNENYTVYSLDSIRRRIAVVPQEPPLLSGSIIDNIAFFDKEADEKFIYQLIKLCELEQTIERFPEGIHTNVYEQGVGLSGGEKQRIAIARALYRKSDVIIFDEATSALDKKTEEKIFNNLLSLKWNPSVIWISHRDYLLDNFKNILSLPVKEKELEKV